jgi:hypothetical protein
MNDTLVNQKRYESDVRAMIDKAFKVLLREHPRTRIYTISIWTDPEARKSAIAIDTKVHSDARSKSHIALRVRDAQRYPELYSPPAVEELKIQRVCNPADYKFPRMATRCHYWHKGPFRWGLLRSALRRAQTYAIQRAASLRIHEDARISINSSLDWYDHELRLSSGNTRGQQM